MFFRKRLVPKTFALVFIIYLTYCLLPPGRYKLNPFESEAEPTILNGNQSPDSGLKIHWRKRVEHNPVTSYIPLPTGRAVPISKIQHTFPHESYSERRKRQARRNAVKKAFDHAWKGYKEHAWLKDELAPISGEYRDAFGGWAATLVDALDTLLIMGMKKEFERAVKALNQVDFTTTDDDVINVFETTIRYLGGLLGAYDLSNRKYPLLLKKAVEVGELLYGAFDTPNRMQMSRWEWKKTVEGVRMAASRNTLLAELGSLSLEFTRLSQLTGDPKYFDAVQRVADNLANAQPYTKLPGQWPMLVDAQRLDFEDNRFTLGGMADSTYEYLPKEHLLLGGLTDQYRQMYEAAVDSVKTNMLFRPLTEKNEDILFSGTARVTASDAVTLEPQGEHLSCFVGGMMGIGAKIFNRTEDLSIARRLVDGCIWAYDLMPTGLMPEVFHMATCDNKLDCSWDEKKWFDQVRYLHGADPGGDGGPGDEESRTIIQELGLQPGLTSIKDYRYILRPEAVESIFILYRITGNKTLQDAGWRMFQKIETLTRTEYAHAGINDVRSLNTSRSDKMESFWLAETLKYFYLLFSEPSLVNLDEYVFNTEAHPLKRPPAGKS